MTDEIDMPATYVGSDEDWPLYKAGAAKVARQRLADLQQMITGAVDQFHRDVWEQVEDFDGESESSMGAGLFNGLTSVLLAAVPNAGVGVASISAFRDLLVSGITGHLAGATEDRHRAARDQLRHVVNELAAATDSAAKAAWGAAVLGLDDDLDLLFGSDPELSGRLRYDDQADWWEGYMCDAIGVFNPHVYDPSAEITERLWSEFTPILARTSLRVKWDDKDHGERLQYLLENREHWDRIMMVLDLDSRWWEIELDRWLRGDSGPGATRG
jgi:hypothetical protein